MLANYKLRWFMLLLLAFLLAIWLLERQSYLGAGLWNIDSNTEVVAKKLKKSREVASITPAIVDSNATAVSRAGRNMKEVEMPQEFILLEQVQERWVRLNSESTDAGGFEDIKQYQQLIDDVSRLESNNIIDPLTAMKIRLKSLSFILPDEEYLQAEKRLLSEFNEQLDIAKNNQLLTTQQSKAYQEHQIYKIKESVLVDRIINEIEFDSNDERDAYIGAQLKRLRLGSLDVALD